MKSIVDRLNSYTYVLDGHLLWGGAKDRWGYGVMYVGGKMVGAHRQAWEVAYGPIPEGIQVNHSCDTPPCLLPWHLYLGTQQDNMQDRLASGNNPDANKTHCPQGHPYDEVNTYYDYIGGRRCRACGRQRKP